MNSHNAWCGRGPDGKLCNRYLSTLVILRIQMFVVAENYEFGQLLAIPVTGRSIQHRTDPFRQKGQDRIILRKDIER